MSTTPLRISLVAVATLCLMTGSARAQHDETAVAQASTSTRCEAAQALSNLQRRIVTKASQGPTSLIRFIHGTRMIYQLDVYETFAWLDDHRAARAACGLAMADAASAA